MLNKWITSKIINGLSVDKNSITEIKICFYIETLLSEIEKLIMIFIVFSVTGHFKDITIILSVVLLIRPYIGGTHKDAFFACFMKTMYMSGIPVCVGVYIPDDYTIQVAMTLVLFCIIWIAGPAVSKYRPDYEGEELRQIKVKGTVALLIITTIYVYADIVYKKEMTMLLCLIAMDVMVAHINQIIEKARGGRNR